MMRVHFLYVGKGDCTIIEFPAESGIGYGRVGIVDINIADGYTNPIVYIKSILKERNIFRFILTHPHRDHIQGLADLISYKPPAVFWDTDHNYEPDKNSDWWPTYKPHWQAYELIKSSEQAPQYIADFTRGRDQCNYLMQDHITVLSPTPELADIAKQNRDDDSRVHTACFVLRIEYMNRVIILGSDANFACWQDIYNYYKSQNKLAIVKADVLKASHHGHESGYHEDAVKAMAPKVVVISDAEKSDSDHSPKYKSHGADVYTTWDWHDLILTIDEAGSMHWTHTTPNA